jgi:hypothetical protein
MYQASSASSTRGILATRPRRSILETLTVCSCEIFSPASLTVTPSYKEVDSAGSWENTRAAKTAAADPSKTKDLVLALGPATSVVLAFPGLKFVHATPASTSAR